MDKINRGVEFIFSSYKRLAAILVIGGLLLAIPMTMSLVSNQQDLRQRASTQGLDGTTAGQGANLFVNNLVLRRNAYPNANCSNGTVVTEGMVLNVGETIEVCVNYGNNGGAASGPYNIDNYLNQATKPADGTVGYQSYPIAGTPIQGSSALQVGSIVPGANCANGCRAGVFIDRANTVVESNEDDNFATSVTYKVATQGTAPACTARPGGMDGFMTDDGTIGTPGVVAIPPPGSYCPNVAPTSTNATIAPVPITTNGTTEYKITLTSTDPQGGNTIFRQYASVNEPDTGGQQRRGIVGWAASGFEKYWGTPPSYKTQTPALPYRCIQGGGAVAIYGGTDFGGQYMNVRWCKTSASGNIRTTEMYVSFNTNFTAPVSNTMYGFTEDAGGLFDQWKPFQAFNLAGGTTAACTTDANCSTGKVCRNSACVPPTTAATDGLKINLSLVGIGSGTTAGLNHAPKRNERTVEVKLFSAASSAQPIEKTITVVYQPATGNYVGTVSPIPPGTYTTKVRMDNTLWKQIPGAQVITAGQVTEAQPTALITGDFNQDNVLNLLDYNSMISQFRNNQ